VKSRAKYTAIGGLLMLSGLLALGGCANNDGNDWQRLVCDVDLVNGGSPVVSAFLNAGSDNIVGTDDDFQPIDMVQVIFHARPYGSTVMLPEDGAYSWFQVDGYDLIWETTEGQPDLSAHNVERGALDLRVPVYEEYASSILLVGIDMKNASWFVDVYTGDIPSFQANARFVFYGHESGSDEEVSIEAGVRVNFIGVVSED
jgi:hypothetical protein